MRDSELFTITYIYNDLDNKIVLMTSGDTLNEASEADYILSSTNAEEVDLVEFIVNSIPLFAMAEPGSKESITHTAEDFQALYDLPFNEIEEKVDEVAQGTTLIEVEKILSYTEPNAHISSAAMTEYTQPIDYMDIDETSEDEIPYSPVLTESDDGDEEPLVEAGLPPVGEVLSKLIAYFKEIGPIIYPTDTKQLFANNQVTFPVSSALQVLSLIISPTVNSGFHLYLDPANAPYISAAPVTPVNTNDPTSTTAAVPGSVGTLISDPIKQKQLLQKFI
ncbi:MAG: hypothetical protein JHC33_11905 [Ignisphaera sp.]|nr:hypothetical protein [Ignisphaera sp.]